VFVCFIFLFYMRTVEHDVIIDDIYVLSKRGMCHLVRTCLTSRRKRGMWTRYDTSLISNDCRRFDFLMSSLINKNITTLLSLYGISICKFIVVPFLEPHHDIKCKWNKEIVSNRVNVWNKVNVRSKQTLVTEPFVDITHYLY